MRHRRGFPGLRCPKCGQVNGLVVNVDTLGIDCGWCATHIDRAAINAMLDKWRALLAWLDAAPLLSCGAQAPRSVLDVPAAAAAELETASCH